MQNFKKFGLGFCLAGSLLWVAPVQAQISNLSDTSGTNTFSGLPTSTGATFTGGSFQIIVQALLEGLQALLDSSSASAGKTEDVADARLKQQTPGGSDLSPESRVAVQNFRDELRQLVASADLVRSDRLKMVFDRNIRIVSARLSADIATANAACKAQGGEACGRVSRLATRSTRLLDALDKLALDLEQAVKKGSAF